MYRNFVWMTWFWLIIFVVATGCGDEIKAELEKCKQEIFIVQKEKKDSQKRVDELTKSVMEAQEQLKKTDEMKQELKQVQEKKQTLSAERLKTVKDILDQLKSIIEAGNLKVRTKRGKMTLELPSAVLFDSGKADLSDKGKETMSSVAKALKKIRGREFQVAGHTDNVKVSEGNPFGDNWHLSTARAVSVVLFLKQSGVNPKQLSAAGYAQYQPTAPNKGAKGKARNRRIEITLMPNLKELPDLTELEQELGLKESDADNKDEKKQPSNF
ncbi:MAG: OmpA family protein [Deltaproteobacteria bacterium]|nr:OmpA family protein [Deltaproteobacteria bacterium]